MQRILSGLAIGLFLLASCTTQPQPRTSAPEREEANQVRESKQTGKATISPEVTEVPATPLRSVVVLPFYSIGVKDADVRGITLFFETALSKTSQYRVIEQSQIGKVLEAQQYSASEVVDESKAIKTAQLLSAEYVVIGTVGRMTDRYYLIAKIVNVSSGANERSEKAEASSLLLLISLIDPLCKSLSGIQQSGSLVLLSTEPLKPKPLDVGASVRNALKGNEQYDQENYNDAYGYYLDAIDEGCNDGIILYRLAYSSEQLFGLTSTTVELYKQAFLVLLKEYPSHRYTGSARRKAGL